MDKYGGSLLSAGGGLVSGVVNNLFANSAARKQHEREKELMDIENQYAIDMFNRTNAYNTPSQQMKRFREAGLNPNLMYGNGSAASGNADMPSAPSSGTAAKAEYPGIGNLGASAYQAYGESLQYKSVEAQTEKTRSENLAVLQSTKNAQVQELIALQDLRAKARENDIGDATVDASIEQAFFNLSRTNAEISSLQASTDESRSRKKVNEKTLDVLESTIGVNKSQAAKLSAEAYRARLENLNFGVFLDRIKSETFRNDKEAERAAIASLLSAVDVSFAVSTGSTSSGLNGIIDSVLHLGLQKLRGMTTPEVIGVLESIMQGVHPPERSGEYNK